MPQTWQMYLLPAYAFDTVIRADSHTHIRPQLVNGDEYGLIHMRPQLSAQQLLQGALKLSIQFLHAPHVLNVQNSLISRARLDTSWEPSYTVVATLDCPSLAPETADVARHGCLSV